ncbi:paired amphipathic helix [Mycena metata]|uniref:Paired amphipathic helix n=1 Tax=Mycena metata TaxID=1033252 RepID=A0AAD7J7W5_9AGAR|nr:paired amphipathic helix [Mycena metata]
MSLANSSAVSVAYAVNFLDAIKKQFRSQPEVYGRFVDMTIDFNNQVLDIRSLIRAVVQLFQGHPDLIRTFNAFLPPGYHIDIATAHPHTITLVTQGGTETLGYAGSRRAPVARRPRGRTGKTTVPGLNDSGRRGGLAEQLNAEHAMRMRKHLQNRG